MFLGSARILVVAGPGCSRRSRSSPCACECLATVWSCMQKRRLLLAPAPTCAHSVDFARSPENSLFVLASDEHACFAVPWAYRGVRWNGLAEMWSLLREYDTAELQETRCIWPSLCHTDRPNPAVPSCFSHLQVVNTRLSSRSLLITRMGGPSALGGPQLTPRAHA